MKLITEVNDADIQFISEAKEDGSKNYYIEGVFMQGEIKNRNGRMYPITTLAKEMDRYNEEYIKQNRAFGELGHPQGPTINLDRVSHMITNLQQEDSNIKGRAKILNTPMGNIVKNLMDEGAKLGVSSRGMGSLKEQDGINVVQDDFQLATAADIVADPSAPNAFVNGIMENVEFWYDNDTKCWNAEQAKSTIKKASKADLEETILKSFSNYINGITK